MIETTEGANMLKTKEREALITISDTLIKAQNPFVAFTGGKDSLTTLHLVKRVSAKPVSVLFIDTGAHFDEIYSFVDKLRKLWGFNLKTEKNEEALEILEIAKNKQLCCSLLKAKVLSDSIKKYAIDFLFTSIRRDEQETRANDDFITVKVDHIQVNPVVYFVQKEIWDYIHAYKLPYCSLYDRGYRSIDCKICTTPEETEESAGRAKEREEVVAKLKELGYF